MNVLLALDPRMHDNILDVQHSTHWFLFVLSLKMILEQNISPDLVNVNETWYTFRYYRCFFSSGREITQTNNTVVFFEI